MYYTNGNAMPTINMTKLMRELEDWWDLQLVDEWDAPDGVREYLEAWDDPQCKEMREAAWAWVRARAARWLALQPRLRTKFKEMVDEAFTEADA
jgi:hypothetical protein